LALDDVRAHFRAAGVSIQKTPEHLILLEDFPRTPAGKILKTELRRRVGELLAEAGAHPPEECA
jgi:non-ribosomal peptide synthetase component E (peptide arylation enzyme)